MHEDKGARYERVFQHPARKIPMSGGHVRIIYQDRAHRRRPIRQFVLQRLRHQILIECIGQPNLRDRAGSHLRNGLEAFALSPGTRVHPAAAICHWLCDSRTRILFLVRETCVRLLTPMARAAAGVRSTTRSRTNGPLSLMVTTTDLPFLRLVTRTREPHGRDL